MRNTLLHSALFIALCTSSHADINDTTDRHVRNLYGCQISTTDNLKPEYSEREHAWASWMAGFADLNDDGAPEVISGYEHEYSQGYGRWTRERYQYGFYSTDPDFEAPPGTRFLNARTMLTQDFNGDGRDDVVFIQSGPDYAPYVPFRNEILLSTPEGYSAQYMNGGASVYHGGAAGDLDGDGDVDVLATPGRQNSILILLNDGNGQFSTIRRINGFGRIHTIKTWDIDGDGHLDILFDGGSEPTRILWGTGRGSFEEATEVAILDGVFLLQDAVFFEGGSGNSAIAAVSSISLSEELPYQGYSMDVIQLSGREILGIENIDRVETPDYNFRVWLNFIHVCDLSDDGDADIIFESFGNNDRFYWAFNEWIFLDKIIWENMGDRFERRVVLNSGHRLIPRGVMPSNFFGEVDLAEQLGISLDRYLPAQTYAQLPAEKPFYERYRSYIESLLRNPFWRASPTREWNEDTTISDRARCIIAERRGEGTEDCFSDEGAEPPARREAVESTNGNWNYGADLSERARRILELRQLAD